MPHSFGTPEIGWPSLSDLSEAFTSGRRRLDVLGRQVRKLKLRTVKIGRERRVEPEGAVQLLRTRGLPAASARSWVQRAMRRRMREVQAMKQKTEDTLTTTSAAEAYRDTRIIAAAQSYAAVHRPTLTLPEGHADFSTKDLVRAIGGGR